MESVTHIYFDWSGTLAKPKSKKTFLYGSSVAEKCATLLPDTIKLLKYLTKKGYILGIISNSSKPRAKFIESLKECGLFQFFKGAIVFSSQRGMCKKPCREIFTKALQIDKIPASQAMMVGNDPKTDRAALDAGFSQTILV